MMSGKNYTDHQTSDLHAAIVSMNSLLLPLPALFVHWPPLDKAWKCKAAQCTLCVRKQEWSAELSPLIKDMQTYFYLIH